MRSKYVLDSSAWVEFFLGTKKGERIQQLIDGKQIATSILSIAELADKFEREHISFDKSLEFIEARAHILPIPITVCTHAAVLKSKHRKKHKKFSLADGIFLATALKEKAVLLTTDADFEDAKEVMII